jgi:hypothetical protein
MQRIGKANQNCALAEGQGRWMLQRKYEPQDHLLLKPAPPSQSPSKIVANSETMALHGIVDPPGG